MLPRADFNSERLAPLLQQLVSIAQDPALVHSLAATQSAEAEALLQWGKQALKQVTEEWPPNCHGAESATEQKQSCSVSQPSVSHQSFTAPAKPLQIPGVLPAPGLELDSKMASGNVDASGDIPVSPPSMLPAPGLELDPQMAPACMSPEPQLWQLQQETPLLQQQSRRHKWDTLQSKCSRRSNASAPSLPVSQTGQQAACRRGPTGRQQQCSQHRMQSHQKWSHQNSISITEGPRCTLRDYLSELRHTDPERIFTARHISKLGFRSRDILQNHYSHYGEVSRVLVAHSKVRPFRDSGGQFRTRPGGLGLVVMSDPAAVRTILALGEEQCVLGQQIRVQRFQRPTTEDS